MRHALDQLAEKDLQKAELVKLRYFAGLTGDQGTVCAHDASQFNEANVRLPQLRYICNLFHDSRCTDFSGESTSSRFLRASVSSTQGCRRPELKFAANAALLRAAGCPAEAV